MSNQYEKKNRVAEALSLRGWKQSDLANHTGIAKTTINGWIKQNYQPKQRALIKMSKALDVSEMWLAGYDVSMERPVAQKKNDELTQLIFEIKENEDLKDLFSSICSLSDDQRTTIKSMVNELSKLNSLH